MPNPPTDLLRHLFQRAMELPPAARAAFVAAKCRDDDDLARRLTAMLAAADGSPAVAAPDATLAPGGQPTPVRAVAQDGPGSVIGPYRLLQQLGEGGFGVVFLAEQREPVQRQVALKIVKLGMDTAQVVARFEQERQALAVMDHPHIAKVFDAGSTATGRPFFVMELCRGEPLTDYCDKNQLTIEQRLRLFEQICHAVQHAHGKGIIHRDLKPSNVLVGNQDGAPHCKVIDFGIAKATSSRLTDRTLFTAAEQVIGTLQYMSPEQAEGSLDIDTRTDVYSLGVILYELLTGSTPFDRRTFADVAMSQIQRLIREVEPHKPSTRIADSRENISQLAAQRRVDERRLPSLVRGELDWLVMKAIEKDRTRRYPTADALALDIQRFRTGQAVEAAPPSRSYRLRKFLWRYRGPVLAAALVFVALIAGIVGTAWGLLEAKEQERLAGLRADAETKERQRADAERDRAVRYRNRALAALRATTGEDVEKLLGSRTELTAREKAYLEAIAQRWAAFSQQAGEDVESRELRAEGLAQVAQLRSTIGDDARVRAQYEESIATWDQLRAEFPDQQRYQLEAVRTRLNLAVQLAGADDEAADSHNRQALDLASGLAARFPEVGTWRDLVASARVGISRRLRAVGKHQEARTELQLAAAQQQRLVADSPEDATLAAALARTRGDLALLLTYLGEAEPALAEYEAIRALQVGLLAKTPDDAELRGSAALTLQNVATLLDELGRSDRAKVAYRTAIDEMERLVADFPLLGETRRVLARTRAKLGATLAAAGEQQAAQAEFDAARERLQRLVGSGPEVADGDLARVEYRMALLAADRGEGGKAIELLETARDRYRRLHDAEPLVVEHRKELADTLNQLGIQLLQASRVDDAEAALVKSRELARPLVAAQPDNDAFDSLLGNVHNTLGLLYKGRGDREHALEELTAACAVRLRIAQRSPNVPRHQVMLGGSHCNVGNLLVDDDPEAARTSFDAAMAVLHPVVQAQSRDGTARSFLLNSLAGRGKANVALEQWVAAADDWDRCCALTPAQHLSYFAHQRVQARARAGQGEQALAEAETLAGAAKDAAAHATAARVFALAATALAGEPRTRAGDGAIAQLRAMLALGQYSVASLRDDPDFAALRDREDFRQLVGGQ